MIKQAKEYQEPTNCTYFLAAFHVTSSETYLAIFRCWQWCLKDTSVSST